VVVEIFLIFLMLPGIVFEPGKPPTRFVPSFLKALGKHVASQCRDSRSWNAQKGLDSIDL